jgi:F0F1-type ATP synthase assembly protein I
LNEAYIGPVFGLGVVTENKQSGCRQVALATTIPLIMVAAPGVGYFIGKYLDKLLGTQSIMSVIFLLLGVVAGGLETYKLIKEIIKEDSGS